MKKIFNTIFVGMLLLLAGCADESYNTAVYEYVAIKTSGVATSIAEDSESPAVIPFVYGGKIENESSFTVNYSITGGTYGEHYTVVGGSGSSGTLTIPAGKTGTEAFAELAIQPTADFDTESNVVLTITLENASNGLIPGYPGKSKFTLTLEDDDCDFVFDDFIGTASSVEVYSDGSDYGPYDTEFTVVSGSTIEMDNFWDSGMVIQLTLDGVTRTVTVVHREWDQYGFSWVIDGTGTLSTCGKALSVEFNLTSPDYQGGYDDTFTINYEF